MKQKIRQKAEEKNVTCSLGVIVNRT